MKYTPDSSTNDKLEYLQEGRDGEREEGRSREGKDGRTEGRKTSREGRTERHGWMNGMGGCGRKEGMNEERKEGRKEGEEEGKKRGGEGRKD